MFPVGSFSSNCYVADCSETREAMVIDPGFVSEAEAADIFSYIEDNGLKVRRVIDTHGHPDHTCGNSLVKERYGAPICVHEGDAHMLGESGWPTARFFGFNCVSPAADVLLHDGDQVDFGNVSLKVLHCPGHSAGSIVLVGEGAVFSGDVLFAGSIGRTDFPGSSERLMWGSLRKLLGLADSLVVYPGHGPASTLGVEKRVNPFLRGL